MPEPASWVVRCARCADAPRIQDLIARSARTLCAADYRAAQIEAALQGAFGLDTQLVRDASYFVVEDGAGRLLGCGGWSRRRTLFGGDMRAGRDDALLVAGRDAARIRAFFVDPAHARRGIGSALLQCCEADAQAHGYTRFELMATLTGVTLYARRGYRAGKPEVWRMNAEEQITFVPMRKPADDSGDR